MDNNEPKIHGIWNCGKVHACASSFNPLNPVDWQSELRFRDLPEHLIGGISRLVDPRSCAHNSQILCPLCILDFWRCKKSHIKYPLELFFLFNHQWENTIRAILLNTISQVEFKYVLHLHVSIPKASIWNKDIWDTEEHEDIASEVCCQTPPGPHGFAIPILMVCSETKPRLSLPSPYNYLLKPIGCFLHLGSSLMNTIFLRTGSLREAHSQVQHLAAWPLIWSAIHSFAFFGFAHQEQENKFSFAQPLQQKTTLYWGTRVAQLL